MELNGNKIRMCNASNFIKDSSRIWRLPMRDNPVLIIDDLKGRKLAKKLKLNITGTLGVILKAKEKGIIKSTKGVFEKLKQSNFRISEKVETELLKLSGE
ncbi:MAG: hypothetical protein BMS9Abin39_0200 [Ignavibacteria bacterium]|nr:MAG: hypothetical protein BMS9Abin39_0200 [Ignavibacteria bacterium]